MKKPKGELLSPVKNKIEEGEAPIHSQNGQRQTQADKPPPGDGRNCYSVHTHFSLEIWGHHTGFC